MEFEGLDDVHFDTIYEIISNEGFPHLSKLLDLIVNNPIELLVYRIPKAHSILHHVLAYTQLKENIAVVWVFQFLTANVVETFLFLSTEATWEETAWKSSISLCACGDSDRSGICGSCVVRSRSDS